MIALQPLSEEVLTMQVRLTGAPDEVRQFQKDIHQLKDFEITRASTEYARKQRYNGEISIYLDIKKREGQ
jgi:hypothetical protein